MFQRLRSRAENAAQLAPHGGETLPPTNRTPTLTDLVIVIISWNVWDHLRACLTSIEQQSQPLDESRKKKKDSSFVRRFGPGSEATLQVVVFDNASDDATHSLLTSRFPWAQAILQQRKSGIHRRKQSRARGNGV